MAIAKTRIKITFGRTITHLGWEAIEREGMDGGSLDLWIERNAFDIKKGMELSNNGTNDFESRVVKEWRKGKSGILLLGMIG